MIAEPGRWTDEFLDAGCDSITFHVEVDAPQIRPALERIREAGRAAGLSVKPATPLAALDAYRELLDIVLVMTVEPGFGGQSFMADVADAKLGPRAAGSIPRGASRSRSTAAARRETAEAIGARRDGRHRGGSALYRAADMAAEVERIRVDRRRGPRPRRSPARRRARARAAPAGRRVPRCASTARRSRPIGRGLLVLLGVGHGDDDGDRRRARAPDLRAADLRGRGRPDEPLAARRRRRVPGRQPVHALRGHAPRPAARVHGRRAAGRSRRRCGSASRTGSGAQGVEVGLGEFGAEMAVELVNDGPFTIWLDTADRSG